MTPNQVLSRLTQDEFDFLLKNAERKSELMGFDFDPFISFSFGFIKFEVQSYCNNFDVDGLIKEAFKDRGQVIFDSDLEMLENDGLYFLFWIHDQMLKVNELEKHLTSQPDTELLQAGITEMSEFGDLNTVDMLAGGDMLKWNEVLKTPYSDCYDKQLMTLKREEITKRLMKIRSEQAKANSNKRR